MRENEYFEVYLKSFFSAFCYSLYDDIIKRRRKRCYVDECCIGPTEFESDNDDDPPEFDQSGRPPNDLPSNSSDTRRRRLDTGDGSRGDNHILNASKRTSQIETELSLVRQINRRISFLYPFRDVFDRYQQKKIKKMSLEM